MTSPRSLLALAAAAALTLGLSACTTTISDPPASTPTEDATSTLTLNAPCDGDEGVTLVVDASALGEADDASGTWCVLSTTDLAASDVLATAGVETEGTTQYGDQVVCRVNGEPSASEPVGSTEDPSYIESCETMPAAFAYWSLWLKPAGGTWDYAQEGLSTLTVSPGESLELLFTLDGAPAAPAA
ncbi:hypothetical protein [Microbacterium sp.]|uniref:hypothetical protein n=1 Tax=Microbacterium sp. TaxID=51671 RepID=UPI0039E35073